MKEPRRRIKALEDRRADLLALVLRRLERHENYLDARDPDLRARSERNVARLEPRAERLVRWLALVVRGVAS